MTLEEEKKYEEVKKLKEVIEKLRGRKFKLDCGHHVTFGHNFGNHIMILNGKEFKIFCSLCCY